MKRLLLCAWVASLSSLAVAQETSAWRPASDVVVSGRQTWQADTTDRAFDISRAEVGLPWSSTVFAAEVRLEAVRSAPPQSLYGTAQNSLIVRLKRVWLGAKYPLGPLTIDARGGLIGDAWVQANARGYDLRENGSQLAEATGTFDASELGLGARLAWRDHAFLHVTIGNGEGRDQIELNRGKNTTAVIGIRPLAASWGDTPVELQVLAVVRDGSQGVANVASHRAGVAAVVRLPFVRLGGEWLKAWGTHDDGARIATGYAGWLQGHWRWLGVWSRWDHWTSDTRLANAVTNSIGAGIYVEARPQDLGRWRVGLAWQGTRVGQDSGPIPGQPALGDDDSLLLRIAWRLGESEP